ncbi:hypothetical protein AF72_06050 [Xylella taiwanensis]|uniref:Uncharacterized protein n=1 Tax=Xylella taiwanensis TaxID=1444770 RepID=Z9JK15_9GAMM|nr:hypothetical protein AB672_00895 [Xylella taiwanensis]EWS78338.1 hypothetical protein AF72_06050 [Xylella taiwanensis]
MIGESGFIIDAQCFRPQKHRSEDARMHLAHIINAVWVASKRYIAIRSIRNVWLRHINIDV